MTPGCAAPTAPFGLAGRTVAVSASVGVATTEPGGADEVRAATLLHRADVAMYAAKIAGKSRVRVHSPALDLARAVGHADHRRGRRAAGRAA